MEKKCLFLAYFFLTALAAEVFNVKYTVLGYEKQLKKIKEEIFTYSREKHLLQGEWSVLIQPARIEKLSKMHLNIKPVKGSSLTPISYHQEHTPTDTDEEVTASTSSPPSKLPISWVYSALHAQGGK